MLCNVVVEDCQVSQEVTYEPWRCPMRRSQAWQLSRLLQEDAGEAENGVLFCRVDTRRSEESGQVKSGNSESGELCT